jgi:hypothetical protein
MMLAALAGHILQSISTCPRPEQVLAFPPPMKEAINRLSFRELWHQHRHAPEDETDVALKPLHSTYAIVMITRYHRAGSAVIVT